MYILYTCIINPISYINIYIQKLSLPHYGKKLNDSIVHSNDATYSKLHVPIVRNIINMVICE